jgi:uncharacterized membrane protein
MTPADGARIETALAEAEAHTTGRIAVRIVPGTGVEALERAKAEFQGAKLHETEGRNSALVLVAPEARTFAVLGDSAIHERVGDPFWNALVDEMKPFFTRSEIAGGIVHAVTQIGRALRTHFPAGSAP